jgi:hypothetical protein
VGAQPDRQLVEFYAAVAGLESEPGHNTANEIVPNCNGDTTICSTTGDRWFGTAFDRNGNMTRMPRPDEPTERYVATYYATECQPL